MEKFNIMLNEDSHTLISIEANNIEEAKNIAILKYLNKDVADYLEKNASFSVNIAEYSHQECPCDK